MTYDSTEDTKDHIDLVRGYLRRVADNIDRRAKHHDESKLAEPEKSGFDIIRPRLDKDDIESDEYRRTLHDFDAVLRHHYDHNSHHPEHYPNGIAGMSLFDLTEMICDWAAASQRKPGGTLNLDWAKKRFGISDQLDSIMRNTAKEMGWF